MTWFNFLLGIMAVLAGTKNIKVETEPTLRVGKERLWWMEGNDGLQGSNACPPGLKFSKTPQTFTKMVESKSSYLDGPKCVTTNYDSPYGGRALVGALQNSRCKPGYKRMKNGQCKRIIQYRSRKDRGLVSGANNLRCKPGYKRMKNGRCKRKGRGLVNGANNLRCKPGYKKTRNGECKRITTYEPDY